jgi:hypothetical protein
MHAALQANAERVVVAFVPLGMVVDGKPGVDDFAVTDGDRQPSREETKATVRSDRILERDKFVIRTCQSGGTAIQ